MLHTSASSWLLGTALGRRPAVYVGGSFDQCADGLTDGLTYVDLLGTADGQLGQLVAQVTAAIVIRSFGALPFGSDGLRQPTM
jgi:hypothetical protein